MVAPIPSGGLSAWGSPWCGTRGCAGGQRSGCTHWHSIGEGRTGTGSAQGKIACSYTRMFLVSHKGVTAHPPQPQHCDSLSRISSSRNNHGIRDWLGMEENLRAHPASSLPWAETTSTSPGSSKPGPTWTLLGMGRDSLKSFCECWAFFQNKTRQTLNFTIRK